MKAKKLVIETDGTSTGTSIFVDGNKLGYIREFELALTIDSGIKVEMNQYKVDKEGELIAKEGHTIDTEQVCIEFEQ